MRLDLLEIRFQAQATFLRLPSLRVQFLKLINNDILPILQGYGLVFLAVVLQLLFGLFELRLQAVGFLKEKFICGSRELRILFIALLKKLRSDGFGDDLGALWIGVLGSDVDQSG